jgi:hypothetical protein
MKNETKKIHSSEGRSSGFRGSRKNKLCVDQGEETREEFGSQIPGEADSTSDCEK